MENLASSPLFIVETPEMFPQLPALAKRLGVNANDGAGKVRLAMKDGSTYDLFALINAFLDRVDAVSVLSDQQ